MLGAARDSVMSVFRSKLLSLARIIAIALHLSQIWRLTSTDLDSCECLPYTSPGILSRDGDH